MHLTPHQFEILRVLAKNEGKLLTHRTILREVWGPGYGSESNLLHVHISQLRRKLEPDPTRPRYILTAAGRRLPAGQPGRVACETGVRRSVSDSTSANDSISREFVVAQWPLA